jgi:hypothetical protein
MGSVYGAEQSFEGMKKDEDWSNLALKTLPVLTQENNLGLSGAIDKFGNSITNIGVASAQGNDVRLAEEKDKLVKNVVRMGADYANSFIPLPSRIISEVGVIGQKAQGLTQKQMDLPFAIDEVGNKKGAFETLSKVSLAALGNVTGINEISLAALGSKKNYAVDWQGRKIVQFRGSDITGSGVQYLKADDILATAGVPAPYLNRLEKIKVDENKSKTLTFDGKKINKTEKQIRYLTDEEYFNASVALGDFNREYFADNENEMIKLVKEDKGTSQKIFKSLFISTKKSAIEAVSKGKKTSSEIKSYIERKVGKRKSFKISDTDLQEETE